MSPASYRAAPPRVALPPYTRAQRGRRGPSRASPSVLTRTLTVATVTAEVATSSFVGDPQPVEVFHAGAWLPGELLGWRFDDAGTCRVRVRCVVGGLRHTAWTYLTHLR